jgi:hypothetical protein
MIEPFFSAMMEKWGIRMQKTMLTGPQLFPP